jgi:hypothetical protein
MGEGGQSLRHEAAVSPHLRVASLPHAFDALATAAIRSVREALFSRTVHAGGSSAFFGFNGASRVPKYVTGCPRALKNLQCNKLTAVITFSGANRSRPHCYTANCLRLLSGGSDASNHHAQHFDDRSLS